MGRLAVLACDGIYRGTQAIEPAYQSDMRNHILACILLAACSKGDAQPAPQPKPTEAPAPAKPPTPAPVPETAPVKKPAQENQAVTGVFPDTEIATPADGLAIMKAIGGKKLDAIKMELNRKFVSIEISPANGKKASKAFCGDDQMSAWSAIPKQVADNYSGRISEALSDPDKGIRCEVGKPKAFVLCELSPQDEHEHAVTFLIVKESYGPVLAGYVERQTWMVDPDSPKYRNDLRERDALLAKAIRDDCFRPESSRGRD